MIAKFLPVGGALILVAATGPIDQQIADISHAAGRIHIGAVAH